MRISCSQGVDLSNRGPLAEEAGGGLASGCPWSTDLHATTAQAPRREERVVLFPSPAALDCETCAGGRGAVSRGELGPDHMLGDRHGQAEGHSSGLVLGDAHKLM